MKHSESVLQQAVAILTPIAEPHTPEGTETIAVVDQWLHALATDSEFFGDASITKPKALKKQVIKLLQKANLFESTESFFTVVFGNVSLRPKKNAAFKFIDLFAGIGGMRLGFQAAGGTCVFSSEFDKHAQKTYKENHGELPFGDITLIKPAMIPDHDVLLAGFPCQPFSHAGLKLGIEDTRGTLFHEIAKILDLKRPKFALLENVKGLVSHNKGDTLKVILNTLTDIGYSCNIPKELIKNSSTKEIQKAAKQMILKSIDFGVPQNRQRIYIVLWQDGLLDKFDYPMPSNTTTSVGDILENKPDPKLTISDRLWEGHQRRKIKNKENGKGFGFGIVDEKSSYTNTISARYYKDGSEILVAQKNKNPRKLSIREAARLQGFPENFATPDSSQQAYKQFGNSVSVPVIKLLAKKISKSLS